MMYRDFSLKVDVGAYSWYRYCLTICAQINRLIVSVRFDFLMFFKETPFPIDIIKSTLVFIGKYFPCIHTMFTIYTGYR